MLIYGNSYTCISQRSIISPPLFRADVRGPPMGLQYVLYSTCTRGVNLLSRDNLYLMWYSMQVLLPTLACYAGARLSNQALSPQVVFRNWMHTCACSLCPSVTTHLLRYIVTLQLYAREKIMRFRKPGLPMWLLFMRAGVSNYVFFQCRLYRMRNEEPRTGLSAGIAPSHVMQAVLRHHTPIRS